MVTTRGKGDSDAAAESTDTLKTVIQSIIRGDSATLSKEILSKEGVTTTDDLVFLHKEYLQQTSNKELNLKPKFMIFRCSCLLIRSSSQTVQESKIEQVSRCVCKKFS